MSTNSRRRTVAIAAWVVILALSVLWEPPESSGSPPLNLAVSQSGPGSATVGVQFAYTITVTVTSGPTNVTLTDILPAGVNFVSTGSTAGCSDGPPAGGTATCYTAGVSGTATYTIQAMPTSTAGNPIVNVVGVVGSAPDSTMSDNSSSLSIPLMQAPTPTPTPTPTRTPTKTPTPQFSPTSTPTPAPSSFYGLSPCRVFDTRNANGAYGGPALSANTARSFTIAGQCGVPSGAKAIIGNFTTVSPTAVGTIIVYPTSASRPNTGVVSYNSGQTIAGLTTMTLDLNGSLTVYPSQASGTVNLLLDVSGYFQ